MPDSANRQFKANPRILISAEDMHNTTTSGQEREGNGTWLPT